MTPAMLDSDWAIFDAVETATLERDGVALASAVSAIFHRERLDLSGGIVQTESKMRRIIVRKSTLAGNEIAVDDVIVRADGNRWTVRSALLAALDTRYDCECCKEV